MQPSKKVKTKDLAVGMRVMDSDGDTGMIIDAIDPHNIKVLFDEPHGGIGLYCIVTECKYYQELKIL